MVETAPLPDSAPLPIAQVRVAQYSIGSLTEPKFVEEMKSWVVPDKRNLAEQLYLAATRLDAELFERCGFLDPNRQWRGWVRE